MRIRDVEAIPLDIGFSQTFSFGNVDRKRSQNVIVKLTTGEGVVGYGEACPVSAFSSETQQSIVTTIDGEVRDFLIDADPLAREPILRTLEPFLSAHPFTMSAIDMALWDLMGQHLQLPIGVLLGGCFRDEIEIHGSIGMASPETMAENALAQVEMGYQTLKLYAGRSPLSEDLVRIQAVRDAVGTGVDFILDVNGLWDADTCLKALPSLKELNVVVLEQPLSAADEAGQTLVSQANCIAIAADESVFVPEDVAKVGRTQTADVINLGLCKLGGITRSRECATVARSLGLDVMVGSVLELGIATAAGLHLAASLPELPYPSYLLGPLKYERQITTQPFSIQAGMASVPQGSGLGIEIDVELLNTLDLRKR